MFVGYVQKDQPRNYCIKASRTCSDCGQIAIQDIAMGMTYELIELASLCQ